ncbi:hypothetical protein AXF42_Ash014579 [Apostasia shenzhenica]|uniref:Uncharacterized protein n=1 Tax=Apostasia shenzhenica TaxID=1088818 RepID=A0A2I0AK40_9ASPA|nr:hypothetical protein AXF42_Ash014579 [Apostasia shenzhenica]
MATEPANPSSPPCPPISSPSNPAALAEMDDLTTTELIFFLESSFHHSEFAMAADILRSREELAKAKAAKIRDEMAARDATIADLRAQNGILEKELAALRSKKNDLEEEIRAWRSRYARLEVWVLRQIDENPGLKQRERGRALKKEGAPLTLPCSPSKTHLLISVSDSEDGG